MTALNDCLRGSPFKLCETALQMTILVNYVDGNYENDAKHKVINADRILIYGGHTEKDMGLPALDVGRRAWTWHNIKEAWLRHFDEFPKLSSQPSENREYQGAIKENTTTAFPVERINDFIKHVQDTEAKRGYYEDGVWQMGTKTNIFIIRVSYFSGELYISGHGISHSIAIMVFASGTERAAFLIDPDGHSRGTAPVLCRLGMEFRKAGIRLLWSRGLRINENYHVGICRAEVYHVAAALVLFVRHRINVKCAEGTATYHGASDLWNAEKQRARDVAVKQFRRNLNVRWVLDEEGEQCVKRRRREFDHCIGLREALRATDCRFPYLAKGISPLSLFQNFLVLLSAVAGSRVEDRATSYVTNTCNMESLLHATGAILLQARVSLENWRARGRARDFWDFDRGTLAKVADSQRVNLISYPPYFEGIGFPKGVAGLMQIIRGKYTTVGDGAISGIPPMWQSLLCKEDGASVIAEYEENRPSAARDNEKKRPLPIGAVIADYEDNRPSAARNNEKKRPLPIGAVRNNKRRANRPIGLSSG